MALNGYVLYFLCAFRFFPKIPSFTLFANTSIKNKLRHLQMAMALHETNTQPFEHIAVRSVDTDNVNGVQKAFYNRLFPRNFLRLVLEVRDKNQTSRLLRLFLK